jgi:hypothetical protein
LDLKFQIFDGKEMTSIFQFWCLDVHEICYWNQRVAPNSKSCLDVQTMELNLLLSFDGENNIITRFALQDFPTKANIWATLFALRLHARTSVLENHE